MNNITKSETEQITYEVQHAGFNCKQCGKCCSGLNNEVLVSPPEIERIIKSTGLQLEDIVEPYPEWLDRDNSKFTFGWVLQRDREGNCIFLKNNRCQIYKDRPHICRTYPFMLNDSKLIISECQGCASITKTVNTTQIVDDLIQRQNDEILDFKNTLYHYKKYTKIPWDFTVFDSKGAHKYTKK
ncbi:MAG TPA: YkgJ family cysteine cluster protein [Methanocorpusculum sp.]|nr:YkgJ family cysteine cluster protein [Methanocorpusculum sp.]